MKHSGIHLREFHRMEARPLYKLCGRHLHIALPVTSFPEHDILFLEQIDPLHIRIQTWQIVTGFLPPRFFFRTYRFTFVNPLDFLFFRKGDLQYFNWIPKESIMTLSGRGFIDINYYQASPYISIFVQMVTRLNLRKVISDPVWLLSIHVHQILWLHYRTLYEYSGISDLILAM